MELERGTVTVFNPAGGCGFVKIEALELTILDEDGRTIALVEGQPVLTETPTSRRPRPDDLLMCEVDRGRLERILRWGFADEYDQLVQPAGGTTDEFQAEGAGPVTVEF